MTLGPSFDPNDQGGGWREHRRARRAAWREQKRRLRAEWRAAWAGGLGAGAFGRPGCQPGADGPSRDPGFEQKIAEMSRTIDALQSRVAVLEKLAVSPDQVLAAEIERLRDRPAGAAPRADQGESLD